MLTTLLQRVSGLQRLDAVRELAAELERLDQAGIPGLKLRQLLTLHTLDVRLRGDPGRWGRMTKAVDPVPANADWRRVLQSLGYSLEQQPQRGYLLRHEGRPVGVVHPGRTPADFGRLDESGRPAEGLLLNDCVQNNVAFGLLAAGPRLRLFEAAPALGSATARYLDLDAKVLQPDDRPFLALLGPAFLAEGGFAELTEEARTFGESLRRRLDETIRQRALPVLGCALGRWAHHAGLDPAKDAVREDLEHAALALLFRALFLLYAEGASYLPMDHRPYRQASLSGLVEEAAEASGRLDSRSTALWDRFAILVKAMRTGNRAWGVPAYNGALFAADGVDGSRTLERVELADPDFGQVLVGLGRDLESDRGVDYSTLDIGHLGHIYEGLLSLRLSAAETRVRYETRRDRYVPVGPGEEADVEAGDLLWQTHEGGRKGGGVYYTRAELVRHLVRQAVVPTFTEHLERVGVTATTNPDRAAEDLFDFAVLDPACGSAHFLVVVVNEIADLAVRFLATTPLPALRDALERLRAGASPGAVIDDVALLRRLVLKRCVYGVDVSPMGAEVAKLSLWLASFVPGLSLAYLDRNVIVGNALVGVARPNGMGIAGRDGQRSVLGDKLDEALAAGAAAATCIAESEDRNPEEVDASLAADRQAHEATANMERLFDLWTAEPFGVEGAREFVQLHGPTVLAGERTDLDEDAHDKRREHTFLHWLPAFPRVFSRANPGFDAVVGNPPWEEVTLEAQSFYALFRPGIRRGLPEQQRALAVQALIAERPDLPGRLAAEQDRRRLERAYLSESGEYEPMGGDPDLYKFFCQRYRQLLRKEGALGVVLPRTVFVNKGSESFRSWLFKKATCERIDFLLNNKLWMFPTHAQFTVALLSARRQPPATTHRVRLVGTARSLREWEAQVIMPGLALAREAFGPGWTPPLLRTQAEADLLAKMRQGKPFPRGAGRWRCFAVRELDETNDRQLWENARTGQPLWKGESFDQYDPHGGGARYVPQSTELSKKTRKPRPGAKSMLAAEVPAAGRKRAVLQELGRARIAFRDVTQKINSRTVLSCLVPPGVFLANSGPYLAFIDGDDRQRAACLALLNSLPFDWQARRFVETHMNFFILEGLVLPDLRDEDFEAIAAAAARLSCIDERYADFALTTGVDIGELDAAEHERLRLDIDARVARAWRLEADDLAVLFRDFTDNAVPLDYRRRLAERLNALTAAG